MTERKETIDALAGLVLPTILLYAAWLVVVAITFSAIVVSVQTHCWSPLVRSGAAIVIVALFLALIDFSGWARRLLKLASSITSNRNESAVWKAIKKEVEDDLATHGLSKSEDEISFLVEREMKAYTTNFPARFGAVAKGLHLGHEIAMAAYGTLLSGFGDVIGGWFVSYAC